MVRFTLLQREPGERFERVRAPGLNRWKRSRRGVRRFAHRQRVRGLSDGRDYRMRVDYRWLDGDGDVIRRRRVNSRTCSLVKLPNLRVPGIERRPELRGTRYVVGVENAGEVDSPETRAGWASTARPRALRRCRRWRPASHGGERDGAARTFASARPSIPR